MSFQTRIHEYTLLYRQFFTLNLYLCVYNGLYVYAFMCKPLYVHVTDVWVDARVCVRPCVCVWAYVYECIFVCVRVRVCVGVLAYV